MSLTGLFLAQTGLILFFVTPRAAIKTIVIEQLRCLIWLATWYVLIIVLAFSLSVTGLAGFSGLQVVLNVTAPLISWGVATLALRYAGVINRSPGISLILLRGSVGLFIWAGLVLPALSLDRSGGLEAAIAALSVILAGSAFALVTGHGPVPRRGENV